MNSDTKQFYCYPCGNPTLPSLPNAHLWILLYVKLKEMSNAFQKNNIKRIDMVYITVMGQDLMYILIYLNNLIS